MKKPLKMTNDFADEHSLYISGHSATLWKGNTIMQHSVINKVETSRTTFREPQSEFGGGIVEITTW